MSMGAQPSVFSNLLRYSAGARLRTIYSRVTDRQSASSATSATARFRNDPARSSMLTNLRMEAISTRQRSRTGLQAVSMAQAADSTLAKMGSVLSEALDLAQQVAGGDYDSSQRAAMQADLEGLLDELDAMPASAEFDGTNLLTSSRPGVVGDTGPFGMIRTPAADVSVDGLGLTGEIIDPTSATLTGSLDHTIDDPGDRYMKGPNKTAAELTITFDGPEGDKAVTIDIKKGKSLNQIVDLINTETQALVPGWAAAEAVQVGGGWGLQVSTYAPGEASAPSVAIAGTLKWDDDELVQPSDFTGQDGIAGNPTGALLVSDTDTVDKIRSAIETVQSLQDQYAADIDRLTLAYPTAEPATGYSLVMASGIDDPDTATEVASSTRQALLNEAATAIANLFQWSITPSSALQLLGLPSVGDPAPSLSIIL